MADNAARIAEIQTVLRAGARSVVTEGVSIVYDFDALRNELRMLMEGDDDQQGRRPVAASLYLGGSSC